ncbi:MAG TPA: condensation domain-containing protein, partial [Blastocatellia bacterium]|nr:condensation domain-containing protein [Blastocatellia bacterium]
MKAAAIAGFRLSPQQRRLWTLQQDGSVYNSQLRLAIREPQESPVLRKALSRLVQRHQILRTRFRSLPGMRFPIQVISDQDGVEWEDRNPPGLSEAELLDLLADDRRRPFDLEQGPLLRASIWSLPDRRLLVLTLPALCADLLTLDRLAAELNRWLSS